MDFNMIPITKILSFIVIIMGVVNIVCFYKTTRSTKEEIEYDKYFRIMFERVEDVLKSDRSLDEKTLQLLLAMSNAYLAKYKHRNLDIIAFIDSWCAAREV